MAKSKAVITCPYCGESKLQRAFCPSPFDKGETYLLMCESCRKKLYTELREKTNDPKAAFWLLLARFGIPFNSGTYIYCRERLDEKTSELFPVYLKNLPKFMEKIEGFWQSDTMLNDIISTGDGEEDVEVREQLSVEEEEAKWRKEWGEYSREDWKWLEDKFIEYTSEVDFINVSAIEAYRDLCKCSLRLRKAYESGEDTKTITDEKLKLMKLLKIDDITTSEKSDEDRYIDRIIWKIEQTEPAEEEDIKKYRDVAGFENAFNSFMRSMKNLLVGDRNYPNIPKDEE